MVIIKWYYIYYTFEKLFKQKDNHTMVIIKLYWLWLVNKSLID